jgi:hypothetical protein
MLAIGVLVWWYSRRLLLKATQQTPPAPPVKDAPACAEDVLNRPDPNEESDPPVTSNNPNDAAAHARSILTYGSHDTNVVMDQAICSPAPSQVATVLRNPFDDIQSIQMTSTHGSNVIHSDHFGSTC